MRDDITAAATDELASNHYRSVHMLRLDLDEGIVAVHSGLNTIPYGGLSYLGVGNLGNISQIVESTDLTNADVEATLSGIPPEYIQYLHDQHWQGRPCWIWEGLLDHDHQLVDAPILKFSGRADYGVIKLGESVTITVSLLGGMADWRRARTRRYTHENQQKRYPGDMGLEFVATMVEKPLIWGRG